MRVGLLTASASRQAGGLFWALCSLAGRLRERDCSPQVFAARDRYSDEDWQHWGQISLQLSERRGPAAFGYTPDLSGRLLAARLDLLHTHGLWMYPSAAARVWGKRSCKPWVVSPHGMLDPWAVRHSGWKKRLAGWAYEHAHLRGAACLHALCMAEAEAIRSYGLRNPICVIPNGVDLPGPAAPRSPTWAAGLPAETRVLLYLGRLHPKKGLPCLLEAWRCARAAEKTDPWYLVIAGWDQGGHQAQLAAQIEQAGLRHCVQFVGPQFGAEKAATYGRADAFVLPSFSEGLPMTVLEAWGYGLPVLMTSACNLPEGSAAGAALETAVEPAAIAAALQQLFAMPEPQRRAMGERGRRLVAERYTWPRVADQMLAVYRWVLGQGPMPDSLMLN